MSAFWKWLLGIIIILIIGIGLYYYYISPNSSNNSSSTIIVHRRLNNSTSTTNQNTENTISTLGKDAQTSENLVNSSTVDQITRDLTGF